MKNYNTLIVLFYNLTVLIMKRIRERPGKRWIEDFEQNLLTMRIREWTMFVSERTEWIKVVFLGKTHLGL